MISKIILGTANFGQEYQNSNFHNNKNELLRCINYALKKNIYFFDSAQSYKSEKILGNFNLQNKFFHTKLPFYDGCKKLKIFLKISFEESIKNLGVNYIETLYLHNFSNLNIENFDIINNFSLELKKKGKISNFGLSIYNIKELEYYSKFLDFDVIQIPLNLFNREFENVDKIKQKFKIKKIIARSIFLQGYLLQRPIVNINNKWFIKCYNKLQKWIKRNNISKLQTCINYISSLGVDNAIIGFNSKLELENIFNCFESVSNIFPTKSELGLLNENIYDNFDLRYFNNE